MGTFLPKNRYEEYSKYVSHLNTLSIDKKTKHKIKTLLLKHAARSMSVEFYKNIKSKEVREHYGITKDDIHVFDSITER